MQVTIFSRRDQPGRHTLERYVGHLSKLKIKYIEIDADSIEGVARAELYDILSFPALLVSRGDGTMVRVWQGELPLAEDVSMVYRQ